MLNRPRQLVQVELGKDKRWYTSKGKALVEKLDIVALKAVSYNGRGVDLEEELVELANEENPKRKGATHFWIGEYSSSPTWSADYAVLYLRNPKFRK